MRNRLELSRRAWRAPLVSLAATTLAALAMAGCDPTALVGQTTQCTPQTCDYFVNSLVAAGNANSGVTLLADSGNTVYHYDGSGWQPLGTEKATNRDALLASPVFGTDHTLFLGNSASTDGGATWQPLCVIVRAISPQFATDHTIFGTYTSVASGNAATTATGTGTPAVTPGACPTSTGSYYTSQDNGQSWTPAHGPQGAGDPDQFAVSPNFNTDKTIFATFTANLKTALYKTSDGGQTWVQALDGKQNNIAISPSYSTDQTVIVISATKALISTDGGQNWKDLASPVSASQIGEVAFSPNFAQDRTIALVSADADAGSKAAHGTFISTDGGVTWKNTGPVVERGQNRPAFLFSPNYATDKTVYTASLEMGKGPAESTDNGATWTAINTGLQLQTGLGG